MCGICGALGAGITRDRLAAATDLMRHRGPDEAGYYCSAQVALGMRRLSIIDLAGGQQPKTDERGKLQVIFNGEIYNFRKLREELRALGHAFTSNSDTEVIAHAYEQWGADAFRRLNGIFAIAVWNSAERTLVLARDHLGVKPLYYAVGSGSLTFASELKPLLALLDGAPPLDHASAALLLRYQYIPSPRSIFEGVYKLPPAHYLEARLGDPTPRVVRYWDPATASRRLADVTFAEAVDRVDAALGRAVKRQLVSDVPLGAFLSGGVDSSTVVSLMQAVSGSTTKTFAIGFQDERENESHHAAAVAAHLGTDHHTWVIGDAEALDVVPRLPYFYDEPFGDFSSVPTFLVSQMAKRHVTVALSGDGGDELFLGYDRYTRVGARRSWWALPQPLRDGALKAGRLVPGAIGDTFREGDRVLLQPSASEAFRQVVAVSRDHMLARLTYLGNDALRPNVEWPTHLFSEHPLDEAMRLTDLVTYLHDCVLTKVDRASMAHSLEARVPILDPDVVELALAIPSNIHQVNGQKSVLKRVLERYVPRALFDRPKHGFGVPIDAWLRGALREPLTDYLSADMLNTHGIFRTAGVLDLVREHLDCADETEGITHRGRTLWNLLMFQMWYDSMYRHAARHPEVPRVAAHAG